MRKKLSSYMTSRYILIAVTVVCIIFVSTSFFTDSLVAPLRNAVSMVVVPLQKGMNNLGLWTYDKVTTLQEISVVLDENNEKVVLSARNIPSVKTALVNTINVYDVMKYNTVVLTKDAVAAIEEVYA